MPVTIEIVFLEKKIVTVYLVFVFALDIFEHVHI